MGRGRSLAVVATLTLGGLAAASTAQAQASDNVVAAEALFEAARGDVAAGNFDAACAKFAESQKLDPAVGTLINLADCEERRLHLSAAWQLWRAATEQLGAEDPRRPVVTGRRDAIDKRVPRLTVRVGPGVPKTANIRRNDVELTTGTVDVALPVDPGEHRLQLVVAGHVPTHKTVSLVEGAREVVVLELGPVDPLAARTTPPTRAETTDDWGPTMRVLGWSAIGVGAVGIGVGTVTGVLAIGKKSDQEDGCYPIRMCTPAGAEAASDGKTLATVSTIGFVVGGVAVAGGALLLWRAPKSKTTIAPATVGSGAGLLLTRPL